MFQKTTYRLLIVPREKSIWARVWMDGVLLGIVVIKEFAAVVPIHHLHIDHFHRAPENRQAKIAAGFEVK